MINKRRSHLRKMYDLRNEFKYALADLFFKASSVFVENIRSGKITDYLHFLWTELVKSEHLSPETYSTDFKVNLRFVKENEELFLFFAMPDIIDANKPNFDYYKWHSSIGVGYMLYFNFKRNICKYYVCESSLKSSFDAFRLGLYKGNTYYVPMYFVIEFVNGERRSLGTISSPSIEEVNSRFCNGVACDVGSIINTEHSELWKAIINKAPFEEIKKMIEAGANLNEMGTNEDYIDDYDLHELFYTCYVHPNCFELVKLFIENGYDYKKIARNGLNAVSNYAEYPDSRVFFYLYSLDQNLMFNPIGNGNSMLHNCLSSGSIEVLKFLEEKGADLKADYDIPLLAAAVFNEDIRILKYLIEEKKLPYKDNNIFDNKNLLMLAGANANSPDTIKYLVSLGFDVNSLTPNGNPIIFETALNPNPEITETFLELGADLNKTDSYGYNIFPYAVMHNENPEYIKYLINKSLSVKQTYESEWTITHYAVSNSNPQILKTLLEYGAPYDKLNIRELKPFKPLDYSIINDSDELKYLSPLALAAQNRTPEVCEILIKAGARLEARDKYGRTPLMMATENPNPDVFRLLLKYGADIKALDYMNQGVLNRALAYSCVELVNEIAEITNAQFTDYNYYSYIKRKAKAQALRMLVEEKPELLKEYHLLGIDPYLPKENKLPYIFLAARNPDLRVLDYLEKKGCDISLGTSEENVFTHAIAGNPNPEIIDYLIKKNLFIKDKNIIFNNIISNDSIEVWKRLFEMGFPKDTLGANGVNLLMAYIVKESPNPKIVELLANEIDVNLKDELGFTASHFAAEKIDLVYYNLLQSKGAKLNEKNNFGVTPLMIACSNNSNPFIIELLIKNGADISERDCEGDDALLWAMKNPNDEIIKTLIEHGANIHTKNRTGENILTKAIRNSANIEIINYLLSLGIDLNEKDLQGMPAIVYAAYYHPNPEIIELLVQKGTNINYLTDKKENVLIFAARNNPCVEVLEYLLDKGFDKNYVTAEGETPILAAAQNPNYLVLEKLIEKGANLKAVDNDKRNALFIASKCNDKPYIISILIEKGIPVNYRDQYGNTAVLFAAQNNNVNILKTLVEKGADLNSVNDAGITALMSALIEGNNNIEMIKYLIENGIDVNAKNADDLTAIMIASASITDPEIIKLLITAGADISEEDNNGYDSYRIAKEFNPNPVIAETIKKYSLMSQTNNSIFNIPMNIN